MPSDPIPSSTPFEIKIHFEQIELRQDDLLSDDRRVEVLELAYLAVCGSRGDTEWLERFRFSVLIRT